MSKITSIIYKLKIASMDKKDPMLIHINRFNPFTWILFILLIILAPIFGMCSHNTVLDYWSQCKYIIKGKVQY